MESGSPDSENPGKNRHFAPKTKKMSFFLKKFAEKFGSNDFLRTFAIPNENNTFETTFPNSSVG